MENEDVRFTPDFSFVEKIKPLHVDGIHPVDPDDHPQGENKKNKREAPHKQEAKDRFDELANAAAASNAILIRNHSPYRFCVYRKGGEVFIDLVALNKEGKIGSLKMANITHDDFSKWIRHIEEREGLFLDQIG